MKRYSLKPWRTLSVGPAGRRREAPSLCTSGTKQCTRAGQAKSPAARPSAGISSATSSGPEHSGPHCHHDTGKQQLVTCDVRKACKRYADEFLRDPRSTTHEDHRESVCHRQKKQMLCERLVHRHGAILLIVWVRTWFNPRRIRHCGS